MLLSLPLTQLFQVEGTVEEVVHLSIGHINSSFRVTVSAAGAARRFLLQRLNHQVFQRPEHVMDNILRVTSHLSQRLKADACPDLARRVLRVVPGRDGAPLIWFEGGCWRLFDFIESCRSYESPDNPDQAKQAAFAFGRFGALLADLPGPPLHETIPHFHDGPWRLAAFEEALRRNPCQRAAQVSAEVSFVLEQKALIHLFSDHIRHGRLALRVTHNDTKLNNLLFDDATGEALCVVDLDTVMPGLALFDFADLARSSVCEAAEDEPDLTNVILRADVFAALVEGFSLGAGASLSRLEWDLLVVAVQWMALVLGIRFLTDHLLGDPYFKVTRPDQNLDRCRTQFKLAQLLGEQMAQLNAKVGYLREQNTV